jgi:phospholipid transport system substrate-binding protein
LLPALLAATSPDEPALEAVRRTLRAAKATVEGEGDHNAKLAQLREVARSLFDTRAMGRSAMGDVLARQPEAKQEEFLELFDAFIVRAYLQKLLFFRNPRFGYGRTVVQGEDTVVHTRIESGKEDYYVDYVMRWGERGWQATDIIVEGVSLLQNHREQFRSLLRSHTFDELLERLRRKVARQQARETT